MPGEKDMIRQAESSGAEEQKRQIREFFDSLPDKGIPAWTLGLPHGTPENKEAASG